MSTYIAPFIVTERTQSASKREASSCCSTGSRFLSAKRFGGPGVPPSTFLLPRYRAITLLDGSAKEEIFGAVCPPKPHCIRPMHDYEWISHGSCASAPRPLTGGARPELCVVPVYIGTQPPSGLESQQGVGTTSHGHASQVSRTQICIWQTTPEPADAYSVDTDCAGGTDRRASAQRAELGNQ